jgi:lipopolysaccharide transport system permease protein
MDNLPHSYKKITVIEPEKGWLALDFREIWAYRDLLYLLIWRDIKSRYRQMALDPLWIVLQPLMTIAIFSIVFGKFARISSDGVPYPVFAYTALLPWQLFATAATKSSESLVSNLHPTFRTHYVKRISANKRTTYGVYIRAATPPKM